MRRDKFTVDIQGVFFSWKRCHNVLSGTSSNIRVFLDLPVRENVTFWQDQNLEDLRELLLHLRALQAKPWLLWMVFGP